MVFVFYSYLFKEYTLNTVEMKTKWFSVLLSLFIKLNKILYTVRGQKSFCTNIFPYIFHKTTYYQKHSPEVIYCSILVSVKAELWCCEFGFRSGRDVQHYVIKFVSDLRQVGGFLRVLRFPPPIKLTATI
jgi:hypothetical protein